MCELLVGTRNCVQSHRRKVRREPARFGYDTMRFILVLFIHLLSDLLLPFLFRLTVCMRVFTTYRRPVHCVFFFLFFIFLFRTVISSVSWITTRSLTSFTFCFWLIFTLFFFRVSSSPVRYSHHTVVYVRYALVFSEHITVLLFLLLSNWFLSTCARIFNHITFISICLVCVASHG